MGSIGRFLWILLVMSLLAGLLAGGLAIVQGEAHSAPIRAVGVQATPGVPAPQGGYPASVRLVSLGSRSEPVLTVDRLIAFLLFLLVMFSAALIVRLAWPEARARRRGPTRV